MSQNFIGRFRYGHKTLSCEPLARAGSCMLFGSLLVCICFLMTTDTLRIFTPCLRQVARVQLWFSSYIYPVYAPPAPVVERTSPAPGVSSLSTSSCTYAAPLCYGAPAMIVTGVVLNRNGIPDVLQQPRLVSVHQLRSTIPVRNSSPHMARLSASAACAAASPVVEHIFPAPPVTLLMDTSFVPFNVRDHSGNL